MVSASAREIRSRPQELIRLQGLRRALVGQGARALDARRRKSLLAQPVTDGPRLTPEFLPVPLGCMTGAPKSLRSSIVCAATLTSPVARPVFRNRCSWNRLTSTGLHLGVPPSESLTFLDVPRHLRSTGPPSGSAVGRGMSVVPSHRSSLPHATDEGLAVERVARSMGTRRRDRSGREGQRRHALGHPGKSLRTLDFCHEA